jgi:hypothetical protein
MKTILFNLFQKKFWKFALVVILWNGQIQAQNWEPVYFSETANFDVDGQVNGTFLYLYPFSADGDTITGRFLPNLNGEASCNSGIETGCVTSNNCKVATSSFLQEYAVFMPGGVVEFQNPDTFQIHSLAQLGESWIFKTDEIGNPVMAEVTEQYSGTVLGETDSIKIVSVADGTTFHLSKNHGITYWSDANANFELSSIPARNLGGSNLSNASVFDFSVGDVFVFLYIGEFGYDKGFPNYSETGSRSIIRHEVTDVIEIDDTFFMSFQTSDYRLNYNNTNGMYSEVGLAESYTNNVQIPLNEDCHIYQWPIGGPMPAGIPTQINNQGLNFDFYLFNCGGVVNPVECSEADLLGGTIPTTYFTKTASGNFGNRKLLSSAMDLYNGPGLDPDSSPLDVLYLDPRDFYGWETLARCDFEFQGTSPHIQVGETLHPETTNNPIVWYHTKTFAIGEGLGIVAYDQEFLGLGSWCLDRLVMVGYHKTSEEPFGFVPESLTLLSLSTNNNNSLSPLNVFPNPATTTVRLEISGEKLTQVTLHDILGRQVLQTDFQNNESIIDVSDLPKGMYLLRAVDRKGEVYVKKVVVE